MTEETPIACTLGAEDRAERGAWIARLNRSSLKRYEMAPLTLRLVYDGAARAEVERFVDLERACCAFLTFDLAAAGDDVVVTVTAPQAAQVAAETTFAAYAARAPAAAPNCSCG